MSAWQIGLIVVGVLFVISLVWVEVKGGPIRSRRRSRLADQAGVEANARTNSTGSWGGSI
jgi:hypothetical protein